MKILDTEVPEANWKEMLRAKRITGFVSPRSLLRWPEMAGTALVPDNPDLILTIIDHCLRHHYLTRQSQNTNVDNTNPI